MQFSIEEQVLRRIVKRFRGGLVFKAHRFLYNSTLGSRVIKKRDELEFAAASERSASERAVAGAECRERISDARAASISRRSA